MNAPRLDGTEVKPMIPARMSGRLILAAVMLAASAAANLSAASGGLDFDGANDYVTFGRAPGLGAATFTVETWFKREGTGAPASTGTGGVSAIPLVTKGCGEADGSNKDMNYFLGIRAADNVLTADFEEGATGASPGLNHPVAGVTPVSMNVWNHAAVTYDGNKWQLFLNGALEAELVVGRPPRSDSIQHAGLGSALNSSGSASGFFAGLLDEVRIWNYARTAADIAAGKNAQLPSAPGLIGRWSLDETSGTAASDTSGNGLNGTLINGPVWATGYSFVRVPTVTLVSPTNGSVVRNPTVVFSADAQDDVGLATATLHLGRVPVSVVFTGPQQTEDSYLSADAPTSNYGTSSSVTVDGASPHAHGVVRFLNVFGAGPGQVAPGSAIGSATLRVYCSNQSVNPLSIYRLTEAWDENQATWHERLSGVPWANSGADGSGSHGALELSGDCTATGWRTFDVTAQVQEWSDGESNHGFLLVDTGTDGVGFASSESSTPPELTVTALDDFSPVEGVPLVGTNASAFFTVTLAGSGEYRWNCMVTNSDGNAAWAPTDFRVTVDLDSPEQPVLAGPSDNATGVPTSSDLQVLVNDPNGDPMTVTFYGRRPGEAGDPFTLAVLPDTQNYSQTYPAIFTGQTQWILSNKISRNIVFVSHEGDVVNTYNSASQYENANISLSLLDGQVPYAVLPGNHDQPSTLFNQTFPATRYEGQPWYGGHCGSSNDNSYQIFSAGGLDFVIVHLQFNPPAGVMAWADSVLKAHANRRAILTTHGYLSATGARSVDVMGSTEHLWTQLAVPNPNVFFMLCGHEHGEYARTDFVGDRPVHQLLADYQADANGGNGWLRLMRFVPAENRVQVETYSPYLNQFQTDADSQFSLDFSMAGFQLVGEVQQVSSGALASVSWPGLTNDTEHEWYVKVTDSTGRSSVGPVWRFTTRPANLPPIASAQTLLLDEDSGLNIALSGADPEGQSLAFEITSQPAHGVLTGTPPDVTYTPSLNYFGPDSFSFRANDGVAVSEPAEVSISVAPVNDAPVAFAQDTAVNEDVPLAVTLGGADPDNDPLEFAVVLAPMHGTLTGVAPDLTYTPEADFHGPDSFAFVASDVGGPSPPASVTITVNPVNDPPVAQGQSITTAEDNAWPIALGATDVENDPMEFFISAPPSHGTLSGTPPNLVYTPAADYHGSDSFSFLANDGTSDSPATPVSITVTPVNDAPVAGAQEVVTAEDAPTPITLSCSDADDDSLTFVLVAGPTNGVLGGEFPDILYTPATNTFGTDSFIFKLNDGQADSAPATVSITVTPVNDAPLAEEQSLATAEDTDLPIALTAMDVESEPLTYTIVDGPAHGTLSGTPPSLVYTPAANYHGADSFTFRANDGTSDGPAGTISLTVLPVNDVPVAEAQSLNASEDTPAPLVLNASDADGDLLTFLVEAGPAHGILTGAAPQLTYTPEADYFGADSFTFKVSDGTADSPVTTVAIEVASVNDAPAVPGNITAAASFESVQISWAPSTDPENDAVAYRVRRGMVSGSYDSLISVALTSWRDDGVTNGQTYFYVISAVDAAGAESGWSGEVVATPTDDRPPVISAVECTNITAGTVTIVWTTDEPADSVVEFGLEAPYTDIAADTNLVLVHSVTLTGLTAGTNYVYRVRSADVVGNASASEEFLFATRPGNQIPVAQQQVVSTPEDQALAVVLTATDGDNDPLYFQVLTAPSHGMLVGTAPALVYTPEADYHGTDSFTFLVNDGQADSAPAEVEILVTPINDVPVAEEQSLSIAEDTGLPIALTATDVEADLLAFAVLTGPAHGLLSGDAPDLVYTPSQDYHGTDSFTFMVNDGQADSAEATVLLTVTSVNDAPVAQAQPVSTVEDTGVAITLTAADVENEPLAFSVVANPAHGTLSGTTPNLVYTPEANFHGTDSFTFLVNDGQADSAEAAVMITIAPVNDSPLAADQNIAGLEDATQSLTLTATDVDGDSLSYRIIEPPLHGILSGTPPILVYHPTTNFAGSDAFLFVASDALADSAPALVTITVVPVNDPPEAQAQDVPLSEDTAANVLLIGFDPEGTSLTYSVNSLPAHGWLSGTAPSLIYHPDPDYFGSDSFSFEVNDGQVASAPAFVTLQVSPVNDAPVAEAGPDVVVGPGETVHLNGSGSADPESDPITHQWLQIDGPEVTLSDPASSLPVFVAPTVQTSANLIFMLTVSDGSLSASDLVIVTVQPVNFDAFVLQEPAVTYGLLGGEGYPGTQVLDDGIMQTVTEVASGSAGRSSLQVDYSLHTEADRTLVTALSLYVAAGWSQLDAADTLQVFIWNGTAWADITTDVMADGVFTPLDVPSNYVNAEGNILVRFTDSASNRNEKKDTLTLDLLFAHVEVGTPDHEAPAPPSGLAGDASGTMVSLQWNPNPETDLAGYHVYRSTTPGTGYQRVTTEFLGATTWQDSTPVQGTYFYVVTAVDRAGNESLASNEFEVTTTQLAPAIHVENISLTLVQSSKSYRAVARVEVQNQNHAAQAGTTVIGNWYFKGNLVLANVSAVTDSTGQATLASPYYSAKTGNVFTFQVTSLVLDGFEYRPGDNQMTETSIAVP